MTVFNPSSRLGHGALKVESSEGTAVTPDTFFEFLSCNINTEYGKTPVGSVATKVAKIMRHRKGAVNVSGTIELFVEPKTAGYFFDGFFGAPTTTTLEASYSYLHEFTMANGNNTYTFEFAEAGQSYVHRYFGVQITKITFSVQDNIIKMSIDFLAQKAFITAEVKTAANSGTTLNIDQTSGLTTSDSIYILDKADGHTLVKEHTISSVDSETQLTVDTIDTQLDVGDIVVIKKQTASYSLLNEFKFIGETEILLGDDIDNGSTKDIEDFTIELDRPATPYHAANGYDHINRYPNALKRMGFDVKGSLKRYYDDESFVHKLREKDKVAIRVKTKESTALASNAIAQASYDYGGGNGFTVTATASGAFDGEAGNDLNIVLEVASIDTMSAAISGSTITVSLANTTASKNTGTLIAAAINALTGVDGAADGTGATEFTTAATKVNLTGGRDANEKPMLQIDVFDANYDSFPLPSEEDNIVSQDISFSGAYDSDNAAVCKVSLRNNVASY